MHGTIWLCEVVGLHAYEDACVWACLCMCTRVNRFLCDWMHVCTRACDWEGGRWVGVGTRAWACAPVTPNPSPHSYIENQQHLWQLKLSDLRGLGELRNL